MVKKPLLIKLVSLFLLAAPFVGGLLILSRAQFRFDVFREIVSWEMVALGVACFASAFGTWKVRNWGFYLFYAFIVTVIAVDLISAFRTTFHYSMWHVVDAVLVGMGILVMSRKHIIEPYFNAQVRWWERAIRYRANVYASLHNKGHNTHTQILDLSTTGCFIRAEKAVDVSDEMELIFEFCGEQVKAPVKVTRQSHMPIGYGLEFMEMQSDAKKSLKKMIKTLHKNKRKMNSKAELITDQIFPEGPRGPSTF